jgi:hypothetical protein
LIENVFDNELLREERILWTGQPETSVLFTRADIFLVPFSLLWGGFAFFWEITAISMKAPMDFWLFGIPFVIIGFYIVFGRFLVKNRRKRRTFYALTNQRVLILSTFISRSLQAQFIEQIPSININVRKNGIGTITFGNTSWMNSMYGNTGLEFFSSFYGINSLSFYDIKNANEVYQLVNQVRRKDSVY